MRARALRAPVFLGSSPRQTGHCAPPAHRSFAASYSIPKIDKKNYRTRAARVRGFPEIICFPSGSRLGRPRHGIFSFHWTVILFLFFSSYLFLFFSYYSSSSYSSLLLVSVNFCDFLTPTDAVIENPQKYLAAEKYY